MFNFVFQRFGISVPVPVPARDKGHFAELLSRPFRTIIDVGAHVGEFAQLAHSFLPHARILSFEPLPGPVSALQRVIATYPQDSRIFTVALGAAEEWADMIEYPFTPCSSLLPLNSDARKMYPYLIGGGTKHRVRVRRMDDVLEAQTITRPCLLKMDVQGTEDSVFRGAEKILQHVDAILVETTFVPTYDHQVMHDDIVAQLDSLGFRYIKRLSTHEALIGKIVQQEDSLFERK